MMDQMYLNQMMSDEEKAFHLVYPELQSLIFNAPIDSDILLFQELANSSSVYFLDTGKLFFRIRIRKKSCHLLIPEGYEEYLPENAPVSRTKADVGMIRVGLQGYEDILTYAPVLRRILDRICRKYRDFGCCSRYEECSDVMACTHPNPRMAIQCWYLYNMRDGKIFYGKNRNIP